MTIAVEAVTCSDVSTDVSALKNAFVDALSTRIQIWPGVEQDLPRAGGNRMGCITLTEFVLSALQKPRFSSAIHTCY